MDCGFKDESTQIHEIGVKVKKEIEIYEEPVTHTNVDVKVKEEILVNGERAMLQRHMRTSLTCTGENPYRCSQCDNTSPGINQLIIHLKIHYVETLYQCSHCDRSKKTKS
ncbi:unnamed protein product, partial [Meganyctiphanes norvegica]